MSLKRRCSKSTNGDIGQRSVLKLVPYIFEEYADFFKDQTNSLWLYIYRRTIRAKA